MEIHYDRGDLNPEKPESLQNFERPDLLRAQVVEPGSYTDTKPQQAQGPGNHNLACRVTVSIQATSSGWYR